METFQRDPVGKQSHAAESGQQPQASLAWQAATSVAKRRQRGKRALLLSPEISVAGAHVVSGSGGRAATLYRPGVAGPTGVEEQGVFLLGFPRNSRGLFVSGCSSRLSGWCRTANNPAPGCVLWTGGSEATRHTIQYRPAKLRSGPGGTSRSQSVFIVPKPSRWRRKEANLHPRGASAGKGDVGFGNRWRERWRVPRNSSTSLRDNNG